MNQSTVIVGALLVAFIVWVTLNGHLGAYLSALGLGGSSAGSGTSSAAGAAGTPSVLANTIPQLVGSLGLN